MFFTFVGNILAGLTFPKASFVEALAVHFHNMMP